MKLQNALGWLVASPFFTFYVDNTQDPAQELAQCTEIMLLLYTTSHSALLKPAGQHKSFFI